MKVWAKVMRGDKILRDVIYEGEHKPSFGGFREAVQSVAYLADVSTPVLLPAHYERFEHFNRVKFVPSDFIEEVDFTAFILERARQGGQARAPHRGQAQAVPNKIALRGVFTAFLIR